MFTFLISWLWWMWIWVSVCHCGWMCSCMRTPICRLLLAYAGSRNGNSKFLIGTLESLSGPFISTCMIFWQLQKKTSIKLTSRLILESCSGIFSYWLCSDFEQIKQVHQHRNLPPCLAVVSVSVCVLTDDVNAIASVCEISLQAYTWEVRSSQSKYKINYRNK